jgi:ketosteroid isomerase-like protein
MKTFLATVVLAAGVLAAGVALAQDFKSQAAAAAAQWDAAFNAGDASKLTGMYTKDAVILPAGGTVVKGSQAATDMFAGFIKGSVKSHKITVEGGEMKGDLGYAWGKWEADAGGKKIGGHWTNVLEKEGGQWRTALLTFTDEKQQ